MKFGIIKERKTPVDRRVVLSPNACQEVIQQHLEAKVEVEPSDIRVFKDEEYTKLGITISSNMKECDVLLGVKEVPISALIPNKKYFFFSHTIKKQAYNRKLLQAVLDKNIELYDHEVITAATGQRLVAFGYYAGVVGAYNGLRAFGLKSELFQLPKAQTLKNQEDLIQQLNQISLPTIKILLTGKGRVGNGAKEMLDAAGIKEVSISQYLNETFNEAVYCQLDVMDYNIKKDDSLGTDKDFFKQPELYKSNFFRFSCVTDFYIAGHFFGDGAPYLFTREEVKHPDFNIKVVADISCDIDGPVATTLRASTIEDPIYGYEQEMENEVDFKSPNAIAVMAVDNLPAELPRDASNGFGKAFVQHVIPAFFNNDKDGVLERARMTKNGKLTERYSYLQDFVDEGK